MNKRNILRILGAGIVFWGAGVLAMNNTGMASCTPEAGISGFLHKAFFGPTAACAVSAGTCSSPGTTCTMDNSSLSHGSGNSGKCTQTTQNNVNVGCACLSTAP